MNDDTRAVLGVIILPDRPVEKKSKGEQIKHFFYSLISRSKAPADKLNQK